MRIIVLGSNSFAGSSFVNFSLNKGEKLIGLSRSSEKSKTAALNDDLFLKINELIVTFISKFFKYPQPLFWRKKRLAC